MKQQKRHIYLDDFEWRGTINGLNEFRNKLIREGREHSPVWYGNIEPSEYDKQEQRNWILQFYAFTCCQRRGERPTVRVNTLMK